MRFIGRFLVGSLLPLIALQISFPASARAASDPIRVTVDLTEAPRKIFHAQLAIPVSPGPLTLLYPKWIPGEHGPTGPIVDLAGLVLSAGGQPVPWQRDSVEMYAFHCTVPKGVGTLNVSLDYLSPADVEDIFSASAASTAKIAVLNWNQVLLYPGGVSAESLTYVATVQIPAGWKFGTALPVAREAGSTVEFKPASLVTLVDSPVLMGAYCRTIELAPDVSPRHFLSVAADSKEALEISPEVLAHYNQLVREAHALFGSHHYREYHFLYALSEHLAYFGLEHHESSDNRYKERVFLDSDLRLAQADLLPHEFAHSWNGKYRRPADLTSAPFVEPMKTDLLWVYEGLTQYLGYVLAARSGLLTPEQARGYLALIAASLENEPGRSWRPLLDTAVAAQILYGSPAAWRGWRRSVDFYDESLLFWLEADTIIRRETKGRRSLDDFCLRFHGGQGGAPAVKTYTFDDVVTGMNDIAPYDWRAFFLSRVTETRTHAPMGGVEGGGWKLAYVDSASEFQRAVDKAGKRTDCLYSLGFQVKEDGTLLDVLPHSPAAKAGLAPGMKLVAVSGRRWNPDVLKDALSAAVKSAAPIEIIAVNGEFYATYKVSYRGGVRYPTLVRNGPTPDLLSAVLAPRVSSPTR